MNKHLEYFKYVLKHKYFVFKAGRVLNVPLRQLIIHDWSKFTAVEWFPYVQYFYGDRSNLEQDQINKEKFNKAWLHHQHVNSHHWQHWILTNDEDGTNTLKMPDKYVKEMVADWAGAGKAITGRWEVKTWWIHNKEKIVLHPMTRLDVEMYVEGLSVNLR